MANSGVSKIAPKGTKNKATPYALPAFCGFVGGCWRSDQERVLKAVLVVPALLVGTVRQSVTGCCDCVHDAHEEARSMAGYVFLAGLLHSPVDVRTRQWK